MKKLFALLLAAAMLLTLGACGKKNKGGISAEELEGTWTMTLNTAASLSEGSVSGISDLFDMMNLRQQGLRITTDVTFADETMTVDPAGLADFYRDLFAAMEDWLAVAENAAAFDTYCQENGQDKDTFLRQIADDTLPETLAAELVKDMGDLHYEVDGNKLYTWNADGEKSEDEYFQFYYKDGTITVHKVVSEGETTELNGGDFVFVKQ